MRKLLMALSLFSLPLLGQLRAPERLGSLALLNMPNGFAVMKDKHITPIEPDCVDSTLRKMDYKQRTQYMLKGGGLELNQANTGEYTIKAVANLKGGGILGAKIGFWVGKFTVYFVAHAGMLIASACTGPAAPATYAAMVATTAIPLEAASNIGGLTGGIVGGVATGPV